jgi:hypothetical protein
MSSGNFPHIFMLLLVTTYISSRSSVTFTLPFEANKLADEKQRSAGAEVAGTENNKRANGSRQLYTPFLPMHLHTSHGSGCCTAAHGFVSKYALKQSNHADRIRIQ